MQFVSASVILAGTNFALVRVFYLIGTIPYGSSFPVFYLFARAYLGIKGGWYNLLLVGLVLVVGIFGGLLTPSLLFDPHFDPRVGYYVLGFSTPLMIFEMAIGLYLYGAGMFHFIRALHKETAPIERNRLWYLIVGSSFSFLGIVLIFIPPIHILPWDMIGITITSFFLTYATVRYHLLNIEVIIKQSFIYSIISLTLVLLFIFMGYILTIFGVRFTTLMPTQLFLAAFLISAVVQYLYLNQQKILKLLEKEQRLNKEIRDVLLVTAHELRTPLAIIAGNIFVILSGVAQKDNRLTPLDIAGLRNAAISSNRLINMVNNYINMSLLEAGIVSTRQQRVNACEITQKAVEKSKILLSANNNVQLIFACNQYHHLVNADPDKLMTVMINLIDNGIKFTSVGTVTIEHSTQDGNLITAVTDTGIGIPADKQSLLFRPMKQLSEDVMTRESGGLGLGLFIGKRLIETMKGQLWLVKSEEGRGSIFAFSLPLSS